MAPVVSCSIQLRDGHCRSQLSSSIAGEKASWAGEGWQQEVVKVWLEDAGEVQPGSGTSSRSGSSQNRSLSPAPIHDRLQTQTSSTWTLAANGLLINSVEKAEEFVAKLYEVQIWQQIQSHVDPLKCYFLNQLKGFPNVQCRLEKNLA